MNFEQLGLLPETVKKLQQQNITEATMIQEKSIPIIREGKDLIGMSKTGSGKTLAFGLPLLEKIQPKREIQLLVMAPTRELAVQIARELQKYALPHTNIATIYGGVSLMPQIDELRRAQVVVGTPGRLLDHLERRNLNLTKLTSVVLDEADKMVEMGFIEDITEIISYTPEYRQMLLFGATISNEIDHLKKRFMHQPETAEAEKQVKEDLLEQYYYNVQQHEKFSLLTHLLKKEKFLRVIVFCSACHTVEAVAKNLKRQGLKAEPIHGRLSQSRRLRMMDDFNAGKVEVLVASPVAARGLDIKFVSHVFNFDLSQDPQEYIHRVGRTARAGESGKAITLLSNKDYDVFGQILSRFRVKVNELPDEQFPRLPFDTGRDSRPSNFHGRNFSQRSQDYRQRSPRNDTPGDWRSQGHSQGRSRNYERSDSDRSSFGRRNFGR